MLRNVLENAVRHSPTGGVVRVVHSLQNGMVRITVADQGPGIDEDERATIFEPFFRSKSAAKGDGSGLGLSIAREIARAHDGELVLGGSPGEGRGATFVISLRYVGA
jgi:signal transduction histidine kinase